MRVEPGEHTGDSSQFEPKEAQDIATTDELSLARAREYLLLANLFIRPPSAELLAELSALRGDASPLGVAHEGLAQAAADTTQTDVAREYMALFIGVGRGDVLPYASYYRTGFLNERPLARVREHMARLDVERQANVFEPEDHIASLFEVMAGIIIGEFGRSPAEADLFFEKHIAPWAHLLMADVTTAPSARFYKHVAELGRVWLEIEQKAMHLPSGRAHGSNRKS